MAHKGKNEPTGTDRKAIHAFLSEGGHSDWHEYAAEQGVSVSGLLEAIPALLFNGKNATERKLADAVVVQARKVDAKRRRRS